MLYLQQPDSLSEDLHTPLNAAEEIHLYATRNEPPPPPPKKSFSLHVPPALPEETIFRHGFWKEKRKKVRAALESSGANSFALDRFDQCGGECVVEYSKEAGKHRLKANYCHNRHCQPCMQAKANKIAGNLRKRLEQEGNSKYRFITLTMRHGTEPLYEQIKKLNAAFKKLRSMKGWKTTQKGGATALEVKWNPEKREWHPHLHLIAQGLYLDKFDLGKMWAAACPGSFIVNIKALNDEKAAAHYVSKYVGKGVNNEVWDNASAAQEWIIAMKGVRTSATYGTWRGYALTKTAEAFNDWKPVYTLRGLIDDVRKGEPSAILLYCKLDNWKLDDEKTKAQRPAPA